MSAVHRVLLLDHERHTEKLVVQVITTVIPGTSPDHALNCYHTAKKLGQAIITSCIKGELVSSLAWIHFVQNAGPRKSSDTCEQHGGL